MTASCLSCHRSTLPRGPLPGRVWCLFMDTHVCGSDVCLSWAEKGGQGSFYGSPEFSERRGSQQEEFAGSDRRGRFGVSVSGSYVIPGLSATVALLDHE